MYLPHQEDLTPASVSSHQVDIKCVHSIRYPTPEAAVSEPEVKEAMARKLQMTSEAEYVLLRVDCLMDRLELVPVSDIPDVVLEDSLIRLEGMAKDAQACLQLFMTWKETYKTEMDANLKQQVEDEVARLIASFKDYELGITDRKKALQSTPYSPLSPHASPPPCPEPRSAQLCSEKDQTPKLQLGDQVPGSDMTLAAVSQHVHSGGQDLVNNLQQKEDENRAMQMTAKFDDTAFAKDLLLEKTKAVRESDELLTVEADMGNKFLDKKPAMDVTGKKRTEPLEAP
jgi:hypothetical protein